MKSTIRTVLALVCATALLVGCASSGSGGGGSTEGAATTVTDVAEIAGEWVLAGNDAITLEVTEAGEVFGSGGCNRYSSTVTIDPSTGDLTFGPAVSTRMACLGDVMDAETEFLTNLDKVTSATVGDEGLTLETSDGTSLVFVAA